MSISNFYSYYYDNSIGLSKYPDDYKFSQSILEKKHDEKSFYSFYWKICQENININIIQQLVEISKNNNITIDFTKFDSMAFRFACYFGNAILARFILKLEPNINMRVSNDTIFINACFNNHESIIKLLIEENPYVYTYCFKTGKNKINSLKEEKEAMWETKRSVILASSHYHSNDTIFFKMPNDLVRIIVQFLYK